MQVDDLLNISQSEAEALDIVLVAGVYTVELVEYLAQVLLLDALTGIADTKVQLLVVVPCTDIDIQRLVGLAVLHGIVHQIGDGVLEVNLIDVNGRVYSFYLGVYLASGMLHTQGERLGNLLHHLVQVEFLLLEDDTLLVEHRHLKHLRH